MGLANTRAASWFDAYDAYHRTAGNEACHAVGIPLIVTATARLLGAVTLGPVTLAHVVVAGATLFYLRLSLRLGLVMGALLAAVVLLTQALAGVMTVPVALAVFVTGWILQLIGHLRYEHRAPAFAKNLAHLLVGPAWLVARALRWWPRAA